MQLAITPEVFEHTYQGHTVRAVVQNGEVRVCGMDLTGLTGMTRTAIRRAIQDLDPSDRGVHSVNTPGGPQQTVFVTESGACQIIIQSRKPEAAKLRKAICDLFVAVRNGRIPALVAPVVPTIDYQALAAIVATAVTEAMKPVLMALNRTQAVLPAKHVPLGELPVWTAAEHGRMRSAGFITCADLLARMKGQQVHHATSGGLTRRVLRWCDEKGVAVHRFRRGQSTKFIYVPEQAAKLVLRTGWAAKSSVMAEAQAELFPEAV